jgi:hypothetical protein
MGDAAVASTIDWWVLGYQVIIAGCAIGGLALSIKNYLDRKTDSKSKLKLILEEWIDKTSFKNRKCIRCIINNTGKIPVKYENLCVFSFFDGEIVELYRFKWVSISTENYSSRKPFQDLLVPYDSRMAVVRPQKIVRALEEKKIDKRNIPLIVELKSSQGDVFTSNEIRIDLSNIDSYDPDSNRID